MKLTQKQFLFRFTPPQKLGIRNVNLFTLSISLLAGLMIGSLSQKAFAQGKDMGESPVWMWRNQGRSSGGNSGYTAPAGPSPAEQARNQRITESNTANDQGVAIYNKRDWAKAVAYFQEAVNKNPDNPACRTNLAHAQDALKAERAHQQAQQAHQQRLSEAYNTNERGNALFKKGDLAKAVQLYEEAARKSPNDKTIRGNLAEAQRQLQAQHAEADAKQRDKTAASNMQRAINSFAETLNAAPASSGGLDFDGRNSGTPPGGGGNGGGLDFISTVPTASAARLPATLEFGDPMVVNAQNVPSGLPPAVDTAIAGGFASAPPGVSDRVRKGFQAATTGDWNVASAWFEDALKRDPGNVALKNLVAAARSTAASPVPKLSVAQGMVVLDAYLDRGLDAQLGGDAAQVKATARSSAASPTSKLTTAQGLQLPTAEDLKLLFDQRSRAQVVADEVFMEGLDPGSKKFNAAERAASLKAAQASGDAERIRLLQDMYKTYDLEKSRVGRVTAPASATTGDRPAAPFLQLLLDAMTKPDPRGSSKPVSAVRD